MSFMGDSYGQLIPIPIHWKWGLLGHAIVKPTDMEPAVVELMVVFGVRSCQGPLVLSSTQIILRLVSSQ